MSFKRLIAAGALGAMALLATGAYAQDTQVSVQSPDGSVVNVTGSVVRFTPGKSIVIRSSDNRETQYTLTSNLAVPADVAVGSNVTIATEPGSTSRVTRISVGSGTTTTTVQTTSPGPGGGSGDTPAVELVTVTGTVQAYEPGHSITVTRADGSQVTYTVNAQSAIPSKLVTGKTVTIRTTKGPSPVVQRVTYTTTTTTTTTK